jgi:hypothetical protein
MKATTIIITAVFSLQVSILFAGNNETRSTVNDEAVLCPTCELAPVTLTEATFEETTLTNAVIFDYTALVPKTPGEANFSDVVPEKNLDLTILAPVTPAEADFNETTESQSDILCALAPVTPVEADFE